MNQNMSVTRTAAWMRALLMCGVMVALLVDPGAVLMAQAPPLAGQDTDPVRPQIDEQRVREAFDRLVADHEDGRWSARWDDQTRLPRLLFGGISGAYPGAPADAAAAFLQDYASLFTADRPGTTLHVVDSIQTRPNTHRVTVGQRYHGLRVANAAMRIAVDQQNRVKYVASTIWPVGPALAIEPALDPEQALARGRALRPEFEGDWAAPELAIYPSGDGVLAYLLSRRLSDGSPLPWEFAIDAQTGEPLETREVIDNHAEHDHEASTDDDDAVNVKDSEAGAIGSDALINRPAFRRRQSVIPASPMPGESGGIASVDPPSPCDQTWVLNGPAGQTAVTEVPDPADPYHVVISLGTGNFDSAEDGTQAEAVYGAGITLLPCIEYTISFSWSLHTWDSYNNAFGYWDVFFVHANSEGFYWSHPLGLPDHISTLFCGTEFDPWHEDMFGPVWSFGGDEHSDGDLCSSAGSFSFTYLEPDHNKTVYLSVGLDTLLTGAVDGFMPSWGTMVIEIIGQTMMLDPNPVTVLANPTFTDMDNANGAVPFPAYDVVTLTNLDAPVAGEPWTLKGDYAELTAMPTPSDYTPISFFPPTSRSGKFPYLRGCHGFEAVMAYQHVTNNQLYIQFLGYDDVNNRQVKIDAHNLEEDQSFYIPSPVGAGYLVFGDGGVDDAEDADVIVHEYAHSIQDNQAPGALSGTNNPTGLVNETKAFKEGFADYWACSYFRPHNEASGFDPALFADWDATNGVAPTGLRNLNNPRIYPRDIVPGGVHKTGEIWSGTMWDIQMALGRPYTDTLVLESNFWLLENSNFADAAEAVLYADFELSGVVNQVGLAMAFVNRGVFRRLDVDSIPAGATIETSVDDVLNQGDGITPFIHAYRHAQALTLTAPAQNAGRDFQYWQLDGQNQTARDVTLDLTMNDPNPPALQLTRTAVAVYAIPGDATADGAVNIDDLLAVIGAWGPCPAPPTACPADLNDDGVVDVDDLLIVISNWS